MQVIDEAARFVPQTIPHGAADLARCVGAIEQVVEEGRNVGIGVCLITQRSARMNKSVSELAECMVAFRTIGPNSVAAILDWLGDHVPKERWKAVVEQLRKLPAGTALVVSPGWLDHEGLVAIRVRQTFDSSATPTAGKERRAAGAGARPDLARYQARMVATIEKAKADDPRELRRQIQDLQRALREAQRGVASRAAPAPKERRVELPVLKDAQVRTLERTLAGFDDVGKRFHQVLDRAAALGDQAKAAAQEVSTALRAFQAAPAARSALVRDQQTGATAASILERPTAVMVSRRTVGTVDDHPRTLPKGEHRVLTAIAQHPGGVTREQLAVLTGYKRSSRDTYVQRLRERGHVEPAGARLVATARGDAALGHDFEPLPTGHDLLKYWLARLPEGERRVLEIVVEAYPKAVDREVISELTGYRRSSRDTYLQRLRARQLVVGIGRGEVKASADLFG